MKTNDPPKPPGGDPCSLQRKVWEVVGWGALQGRGGQRVWGGGGEVAGLGVGADAQVPIEEEQVVWGKPNPE